MRILRGIVFVLVATILCGCADSSYVPPQVANAATLWIHNDTDNAVWPVGYKIAADCRDNFLLDPHALVIAAGQKARFSLRPDEPFSFSVSYHGYSGGPDYVNLPMTFTPKANGVYHLMFSVTGRQYRASMTMAKGSDELPDPTFEIKKMLKPLLSSGAWCARRE